MVDSILNMNVLTGPLVLVVFVLAGGTALYLLVRRPTRRWAITSLTAIVAGGFCAVAIWFFTVHVYSAFPIPLGHETYYWLAVTLAGLCLAIANLWRSRWWRKAIAVCAIPVFLVAGTVGINAVFGINPTVGSVFGINAEAPIALAAPSVDSSISSSILWRTWRPPASMPKVGEVGSQVIPPTRSGFVSRPAGIYLPPAALVKNPPALPLVIVMFGQPGTPTPLAMSSVLDPMAAAHHGLAPIVIVADQLGDPMKDPLCLNTRAYGNAETFLSVDVVNWALAHLNITHDHRFWAIAGYSNGGQCAISLAAKHPTIWSNVLDVSGEEIPGTETAASVLKTVFHGDQQAYDAVKPINIMATRHYSDTMAIFTVGADDPPYIIAAKRVRAAAQRAGMTTFYREVPHGGHVVHSFSGGFIAGFDLLYPRLGLEKPAA